MKRVLIILCAAIALNGCHGTTDKETVQTIEMMLSEKVREAATDGYTPSEIVDVRLFYRNGDKIIEDHCRGFIFKAPNPLANIGIILGTTKHDIADKPFVYSFPVAEGSSPFVAVTTPQSTEVIAQDSKNGNDIYILGTTSVKDGYPNVTFDGKHDDNNIRAYIFVLSTIN